MMQLQFAPFVFLTTLVTANLLTPQPSPTDYYRLIADKSNQTLLLQSNSSQSPFLSGETATTRLVNTTWSHGTGTIAPDTSDPLETTTSILSISKNQSDGQNFTASSRITQAPYNKTFTPTGPYTGISPSGTPRSALSFNETYNYHSLNITIAQKLNDSDIYKSPTSLNRTSPYDIQTSTSSLAPKETELPFIFKKQNETYTYSWKNKSSHINQTFMTPSRNLSSATVSRLSASLVATKGPRMVFAHFMVGNVKSWGQADWSKDIRLAQDAHIDAFALNIASGEANNEDSLRNAFAAAESLGFKLAFSLDYAGGGPWAKNTVIDMIKRYGASPSYYHYNGQPFVSTFEGPGSSDDWHEIKSATGCFFIPSWSSLGAKDAVAESSGVADGLFSWAAWPWGNTDSNTYIDASYRQFLGGKPLMMPVSPWFYTNLPQWHKNWIWRGDDLWFDRWEEVMFVQPEFVQIITWNDFGESHYIGPLDDRQYEAFASAPYNYATNMPHDGWRLFLPYVIDTYKSGKGSITREGLVSWYRLNRGTCSNGGTTGNTASQLQLEFDPSQVVQDKIFYSALLTKTASVRVTIGGFVITPSQPWENTPIDGIGIYHGSVATGGRAGTVIVEVYRSGQTVALMTGASITDSCHNGLENYNAWVGSATGGSVSATSPSLSLAQQDCIKGVGAGNFNGLCDFTCYYGYCPVAACVCTALGKANTKPTSTGVKGFPAQGLDVTYEGLCDFACNLGYCPPSACGTVKYPLIIPTVSPFTPPGCTSGVGDGNLGGLCSFACNFGHCPIHSCKCTSTGPLNTLPAFQNVGGYPKQGLDVELYRSLCEFSCTHGYCPSDACYSIVSGGGGAGGGGESSGIVYIDPVIFLKPSPEVGCIPPCTLVFPSSTMRSATVINFLPIQTSLVVGGSTFSSLTPKPIVTSVMSFFDMPIPAGSTSLNFALTSSFQPRPLVITVGIITTTVYFLPFTAPAGRVTKPSSFVYSLGTTVYVSGGSSQTFSEAQFTDLRTITAPTKITTTLVDTSSGASKSEPSTTIIPFWVQVGGFYWSPIPLPKPTPFKIPTIPEFPPIPTPPCFKLFDIFSIDCPPDKGKPTTTFISAAPTPTCTSGCGTRCTANCDTTGTAESTECQKQTVTDYWVSCSADSCKTTRSAIVTGCEVTASATTTGAYCPVGFNVSPDDDQGDDGAGFTRGVTMTTVTDADSVLLGGKTYTVSGSIVVIDGTTLTIPDVTTPRTTTIGGKVITILPGSTHTNQVPSLTTSTIFTTTRTTTVTAAPPSATQIWNVEIYAVNDFLTSGETTQAFWSWEIYDRLETLNVCDLNPFLHKDISGTTGVYKSPPTIDTTFDISVYNGCKYIADTSDPKSSGYLDCGPGSEIVPCVAYDGDPRTNYIDCSGPRYITERFFYPRVHCRHNILVNG
ncbi:mutanase [Phlyctema vagabunda]|uniref:Mutanase n=1 Tax=Phlyctema vagabunda TaxID=108571 RepID=A0ABR4PZ41_9HELO